MNKKFIFFIITILLSFAFLLIFELGLRLFSYGDDLALFVQSPIPQYLQNNQHVGERFFNASEVSAPLNDLFLKSKPANGYRIFILGESTVLGFPYDANVSFSRILRRRLQDIFPHRTIEVINLGMTAITSYTLLDFSDEILEQEPDAILIYTGHNEYYGVLGAASMEKGSIPSWLKKLHLRLVHLRTYQLVQSCISLLYQFFAPMTSEEARATLMQRLVGKNLVPLNSSIYKDGITQFDDNMSELLLKFKKANVPVIMSDLSSNIRDISPFYSAHVENYPDADSIYNGAKRLEANSLFEKAKMEYTKAKDVDLIRFRASEDLNDHIYSLANSIGVYTTSVKTLFEDNSPHRLVGNNLMTEHLHPNIDGYFLMSEGFLQSMKSHGMIEQSWNEGLLKPWQYYRAHWGYTEFDSAVAFIRIQHLKSGWPFQSDTTVNNFLFTYHPKDLIDSLAFKMVKYDNSSVEVIQKELAGHYETIGDYKRAAGEYLSLAYKFPYSASYFYFAADFYEKSGEGLNSLRCLKESPDADTSAYAQFTMASVNLTLKNFNAALVNINKLKKIKLGNNDRVMLLKLEYNVLKDSGLTQQAEKVFEYLKQINPSLAESKEIKSQGILVPSSIKKYLQDAEALRKEGKLSEALDQLKKANSIKEIPYTNLLIGKILFTQKNPNALPYLEKAHKELNEDPSLAFSLCYLYLLKKDFLRAEQALNEFGKLQGKDNPHYRQLKLVYDKERKKK